METFHLGSVDLPGASGARRSIGTSRKSGDRRMAEPVVHLARIIEIIWNLAPFSAARVVYRETQEEGVRAQL